MCKHCLDPYNSRERKLFLIFLINMCKDLTKVLQLQGFNQIYIGKENYILNQRLISKKQNTIKKLWLFFSSISYYSQRLKILITTCLRTDLKQLLFYGTFIYWRTCLAAAAAASAAMYIWMSLEPESDQTTALHQELVYHELQKHNWSSPMRFK